MAAQKTSLHVKPFPPFPSGRTGLLISVRDAQEAGSALRGGADVIDVKEPSRGPLGRPDAATVARVVEVVACRKPVTAAAGDWGELAIEEVAEWIKGAGASVVKFGLRDGFSYQFAREWRKLLPLLPRDVSLAPVLYADRLADSPPDALSLSRLAGELGNRWLVLDTWSKHRGDLLDAWPLDTTRRVLQDARRAGLRVVLAGGLNGRRLLGAAALRPDLAGARGAACIEGRESRVCSTRVAELVELVSSQQITQPRESLEKT